MLLILMVIITFKASGIASEALSTGLDNYRLYLKPTPISTWPSMVLSQRFFRMVSLNSKLLHDHGQLQEVSRGKGSVLC